MDTSPRAEKKINFGMKCIKYLLIIINMLYLIIAFLMISGATTLKVIFGEYYYALSVYSVDSLSSLWIATGVLLLAVSIFGIAAAVKESTMLTNIYGVVLCLIFILQMAAAITGFSLITRSGGMVWNSLDNMMRYYNWNYESRDAMNWIQKTFECCGNEAPSDWNNFGQFSTRTTGYWETTYPWYYDTQPDTSSSTTEALLVDRMPQSCCTPGSRYFEMVCDYHFTRGCHGPLHVVVSQSVMMIGSSALIIGVVQILGIICAFLLARTIRRNKTHRDVNRWAIHQSMGFDRPAYVDQPPNPETETDAVKHI